MYSYAFRFELSQRSLFHVLFWDFFLPKSQIIYSMRMLTIFVIHFGRQDALISHILILQDQLHLK